MAILLCAGIALWILFGSWIVLRSGVETLGHNDHQLVDGAGDVDHAEFADVGAADGLNAESHR